MTELANLLGEVIKNPDDDQTRLVLIAGLLALNLRNYKIGALGLAALVESPYLSGLVDLSEEALRAMNRRFARVYPSVE